MLIISTKFENENRRVDLHEVRVPGINVLAKDLPGPDLYRAMVKLKVPGIATSMGWQDLAFRLGVFIQRLDEQTKPVAKVAI
jgi:hypothetical protein